MVDKRKSKKPIAYLIGSKNFWKLRIGIGKPEDKDRVVDYVLGQPSKIDKDIIADLSPEIKIIRDKI